MIHLTCYHYRRRAYYLTAVVKRIDKNACRMILIDRKNQILCSSDMINHHSFEQGLSSHLSWSQIWMALTLSSNPSTSFSPRLPTSLWGRNDRSPISATSLLAKQLAFSPRVVFWIHSPLAFFTTVR